jgi:hypothetical protein
MYNTRINLWLEPERARIKMPLTKAEKRFERMEGLITVLMTVLAIVSVVFMVRVLPPLF